MLVPLVFAAASQGAAAAVPTGGDLTPVTQLPVDHQYRSGVVIGLSLGAGLGSASGYPNNSQQIGDPAYYSAGGFMGGGWGQLFLMGALSDYISFGFWYGHSDLRNSDWRSTGNGGGFRIEAFPLVGLVPVLHGLGVLANLGIGSGTLTSTNPSLPQANGTQSFGGVGLFHEWGFGYGHDGHFAFGPALEFDAIWSQPFEQHGVVASARLVFYGGP
jgi:hypothetical protein